MGGDPTGLEKIGGENAIEISKNYKVPLHPAHTYLWHDLSPEGFEALANAISSEGELKDGKLILPSSDKSKLPLETLLVHHKLRDGKIIIEDPMPMLLCLGIKAEACGLKKAWDKLDRSPLEAANKFSGITIRAKAPTRIGARMGRPEKSDKEAHEASAPRSLPHGKRGRQVQVRG